MERRCARSAATQRLAEALDAPHIHTPHSLGLWKKQLMERDSPDDAENFELKYNFTERISPGLVVG